MSYKVRMLLKGKDLCVEDIVSYPSGAAKYRVSSICHNTEVIYLRHIYTNRMYSVLFHRNFVLWEKCEDEEKTQEKTEMLYEITTTEGEVVYGTKLTEASNGKWVMELKGTGAVIPVDSSMCKKVVPYTVSVKFVTGSTNSKSYSYKAKEGQFSVGDILVLDDGSIARVAKLNTEAEFATKFLTGTKLVGVRINEEEESDSEGS